MNKLSWVGAATASAAFGVAVVLAACSSSSSNNPNSGPPSTTNFAVQMASSFCSALQTCCQAAKYQYDDQSCEAQLTAEFQDGVDVVKHGKVTFNTTAATACEEAFANRESQCSTDASTDAGATDGGAAVDPITAACWNVLLGTIAPGGSCESGQECQVTGPLVTASCQIDQRPTAASKTQTVCFVTNIGVAPGGTCSTGPGTDGFETDYCDTTGYCQIPQQTGTGPQPTTGTCTPFAAVGATCLVTSGTTETETQCVTGSYCDLNGTKTCKALPAVGQPCAQFTNQCITGAYCDTTGTGTPLCVGLKPAGASCQQQLECESFNCLITENDDGGIVTQTGVCQPDNTQANSSDNSFDVSPRSCGFGPGGSGPDDAGIVTPPTGATGTGTGTQSIPRHWFQPRH